MRRRAHGLMGAALGLVLAIGLGSSGTAALGRRLALVIGNSSYTYVGKLPSPVKDAAEWVQALKGAGFDVDQCLDCKLSAMKDKLDAFQARIAPGDEAVFYYSGHGAEQNDINLLFPVDADVHGCGTLFEQSVSLSYVLDVMDSARVKVVVLDACRSSPFPSCTKSLDQRLYVPPQVAPDGTLIAYGTTRGDPASDNGQGSAYSRALLPLAFQQGKPLIQALSEAAPKVKEATNGRQVPWVYSSLSGALYALVPGISSAEIADTKWAQIMAQPDGPAKTNAALSFVSEYGTSGAASVRAAQAYLTSQTLGRAPPPPLGKVGDPPAGGPTGRTYVAMKGTAGEMSFLGLSEGVFDMGSADGTGEGNEHPQHRVRVSAFTLGQSEVTQAQWSAVVKTAQNAKDADATKLTVDPSYVKGPPRPVDCVSWCDVARFANALSRLEHRRPAYTVGTDCEQRGPVGWDHSADGYRLPTEAEWEYAARAGTTTAFATGDSEADLARAGWYSENSGDGTHEVCTAEVKPWGLCDMAGNVWEWTWDVYESAFYGRSLAADPSGPADRGVSRVLRGGSWVNKPYDVRPTYRISSAPANASGGFGFRLVAPAPSLEH